jgi:hypothetical protein
VERPLYFALVPSAPVPDRGQIETKPLLSPIPLPRNLDLVLSKADNQIHSFS